jgi:DNA-binding transcriptional regulator YiaG
MRPTGEDVKAHRAAFGLSQAESARLVHTSTRAWQQWEAGDRRMHGAMWELFLIKGRRRKRPAHAG